MIEKLNKYLAWILALLMLTITLDVLWGVFTRYALGNQASWSEELARYLMIWIGLLGTAYVSGQRKHLSIELLRPKLKDQNRIYLDMLIAMLISLFALSVLVIGGLRLMYITGKLNQTSAALELPMPFVYCVLPISGFIILYYKFFLLKALILESKAISHNNYPA